MFEERIYFKFRRRIMYTETAIEKVGLVSLRIIQLGDLNLFHTPKVVISKRMRA